MHSASFYAIVVFGTLGILTALGVASRHRWGCTILTGVYTAFGARVPLDLPLFPAEPKLGPVYNPVTHFIPWEFPLLLMIPALVTDLILQRTARWRAARSRRSPPASSSCATFVAVQWPFANFLMSPLARNWFFGTAYMDYGTPPTSLYARFEFVPPEPAGRFWTRLADRRCHDVPDDLRRAPRRPRDAAGTTVSIRARSRRARGARVAIAALPAAAAAHIGSPDVFLDGQRRTVPALRHDPAAACHPRRRRGRSAHDERRRRGDAHRAAAADRSRRAVCAGSRRRVAIDRRPAAVHRTACG